ncbi:MAG: hypothetical protein P8Y13_12980 [Deinococcales bacterium]
MARPTAHAEASVLVRTALRAGSDSQARAVGAGGAPHAAGLRTGLAREHGGDGLASTALHERRALRVQGAGGNRCIDTRIALLGERGAGFGGR